MKKTAILLFLLSLFCLTAAENLLYNGDFLLMKKELPTGWFRAGKGSVLIEKEAAPDGLTAATVKNGTFMLRQGALKLVPGKEYEISAWVKASGTKFGKCRLVLINSGWQQEKGIYEKDFIRDGKWHKITKKIKLMNSKESWGFVAGFNVPQGSLSFAGIKLAALDYEVEQQCSNGFTVPIRNIIPYSPYLADIPEENPVLKVMLGAKGKGAFFCLYQAGTRKEAKAPFQNGFANLKLDQLKPGQYALAVKLADASGKILSRDTFPIVIRRKAAVNREGHKRLNNLVISLAEKKISGKADLVCGNPRDGWVYFKLPAGSSVELDGKTVRYPEFVRYLAKGNHRLKLNQAQGVAQVRAIPEIFSYPLNRQNCIPGAGNFDWNFTKKYFLPAATTFSGGKFPQEAAAEFKERGLDFLANIGTVRQLAEPGKKTELLTRIQKKAFDVPYTSGCSMDEFGWNQATELESFALTVNNIPYPAGKRIYTWIAEANPGKSPVITDALSILLNITGSRGMALYEAYCVQQKTLPEAKKYLSSMLNEHTEQVLDSYPDAIGKLGLIFGNFNQLPVISLEAYPQCDYKYFLDMQLNIAANHPVYKNLGCVGYWGNYYGDEEMARWSFRLLRHYAIEGRKEMLSPKFGFTFHADYLKNGDFEEGLKHWQCSSKAIKTVKIDKLGDYERRWRKPAEDCGAFCVLLDNRKGESPVIRQKIKGLVPGKWYKLKFCTANYDAVQKGDAKAPGTEDGIKAELRNVKEIPGKRYDGRGTSKKFPPIQIHRRVFQAKGAEAEVAFSNTAKNSCAVMNFVQLAPYYQE